MVIGTQLFWLVFLAKSFYEQRATKNVIKFQVRLIYNMPSPDSSENPFMLGFSIKDCNDSRISSKFELKN
jgi:hypothetical protein